MFVPASNQQLFVPHGLLCHNRPVSNSESIVMRLGVSCLLGDNPQWPLLTINEGLASSSEHQRVFELIAPRDGLQILFESSIPVSPDTAG